MSKKSHFLIVAGVFVAAALAGPAAAHHSFAMFDATKTVPVAGTVKDFQWTNPHSWLQLMVANPDGSMSEYAIEMASPGIMRGRGWTFKTMVPGDKVTVGIHPNKDGTHGGQLVYAVLPDGKQLGMAGVPGGAGGRGGRGAPAAE